MPMFESLFPTHIVPGEELSVSVLYPVNEFVNPGLILGDSEYSLQVKELDNKQNKSTKRFTMKATNLEVGVFPTSYTDSFGKALPLLLPGFADSTASVVVHPLISGISSNTLYSSGSILEIKGSGFGQDPAKAEVKIEEHVCIILQISNDSITCSLEMRDHKFSNYLFTGSAGLESQMLSRESLNYKLNDFLGDQQKVLSANVKLSLDAQITNGEYIEKQYGVFTSRTPGV